MREGDKGCTSTVSTHWSSVCFIVACSAPWRRTCGQKKKVSLNRYDRPRFICDRKKNIHREIWLNFVQGYGSIVDDYSQKWNTWACEQKFPRRSTDRARDNKKIPTRSVHPTTSGLGAAWYRSLKKRKRYSSIFMANEVLKFSHVLIWRKRPYASNSWNINHFRLVGSPSDPRVAELTPFFARIQAIYCGVIELAEKKKRTTPKWPVAK
jgi:hypothetical protein